MKRTTAINLPTFPFATAALALALGLAISAMPAHAKGGPAPGATFGAANGAPGGPPHDDGRGPTCEPGFNTPECGGPQRCCVRVKKMQRVVMPGKRRTRAVLTGWRCYTGPQAMRLCRRMRH